MGLFNKKKKEKETEFKKGDFTIDNSEVPDGDVISETIINEPVGELPDIEPMPMQNQIQEDKEVQEYKPVKEKSLTMEELEKQQAEVTKRIEELNRRELERRPKERIQIVRELPMQPVRSFTQEDGSIIHLMTIEEYLTEQSNLE